MKLQWMGHACFKLTTQGGTRIVVDPYDASVGYGKLQTDADVVITSHKHHDHCCPDAVKGCRKLIDEAGEYEFDDVKIETVLSFHDDAGCSKRGLNLLSRITADGQTVVHLGDLGHVPDKEQLSFISNADVLLLPVGGFYTIDTSTALKVMKAAKPVACVPMHYKNECCGFPISTVDEFARAANAEAQDGAKVLAIGQKAAAFEETDHFVNVVEGGGMTGYEAVTRTCRLIREAFLEKKEMRELVQVKGLGCEVCVR